MKWSDLGDIKIRDDKCWKCREGVTTLIRQFKPENKLFWTPCSKCGVVRRVRDFKTRNDMYCHICNTPLVRIEDRKYETLCEHGFDPNKEDYDLRPTWQCPKKRCYGHYHHFYGIDGCEAGQAYSILKPHSVILERADRWLRKKGQIAYESFLLGYGYTLDSHNKKVEHTDYDILKMSVEIELHDWWPFWDGVQTFEELKLWAKDIDSWGKLAGDSPVIDEIVRRKKGLPPRDMKIYEENKRRMTLIADENATLEHTREDNLKEHLVEKINDNIEYSKGETTKIVSEVVIPFIIEETKETISNIKKEVS